MAKSLRYFLFLLWFSYLLIASILLFTRGFLLSRDTQLLNATCNSFIPRGCDIKSDNINSSDDSNQYCSNINQLSLMNELHQASNVCLPQRSRVVLIVIDALRYDFTLFNNSNQEPLAFQNKLPIIDALLTTRRTSTRLYKFIADPPTTTMQRLKALTTGSLPTFIDAGSNFATSEINEDNLIDQIVKQNKNIVFMGDDTWVSLYPRRFLRSYSYPSFNVFDLDTVDTGVVHNLYPELQKQDWNLLVAHFLGVDHCGHRYGPLHSEMTRKLSEMNGVIEETIKNLDENTMLFVIGDHGMTSTGDHGGESTDEITSAMFVYSKLPLISKANYTESIIKQVDLVPTLATILGVPIPYSNLGSLVVDSLPVNYESVFNFPQWQIVLFSVWSNVQQMTNYIKQYAISSKTFSIERLQNLYEKFALLNARVRTTTEKDFPVFIENADEYMKMLRMMCEEVWVQFDSFSMSRGLVLIFMTIFLIYMIISGIPSQQLVELFRSSFLGCSYLALTFATFVSLISFYLNLVDNLLSTIFFSTGIVSVFMLAILVIQNWDVIAIHWYDLSRHRTSMDFICRLIFLLSWCGLLSNSYIVEEANVSLFLLLSILFLMGYENTNVSNINFKKSTSSSAMKPKWNWLKIKLFLLVLLACILIRLSTSFWKCREEQQWCAQYFTRHVQGIKFGVVAAKAEYLISLVMMAIFVTITRNLLRSWGNLVGFSPTVVIMRYAPTVMVVSIGGYWVLHKLPKDTKSKLMAGWHIDYLAWVVYAFCFIGIGSILMKPLCVHILLNTKKDVSPLSSDSNVIPQLFNHIKGLFNTKCKEVNDSNIPVVYGLATVYSAAFTSISVYVSLILVLLLGDVLAPSSILLYFASAIVLVISAASRYDKTNSLGQLFEVPSSSILTWMLLSVYFFYATGHQATFPNISWEAAFIGTGENFTNNFIPALLVILNTFGSYILMGLSLPLLLIIPFTINVVFPTIISKKAHSSQKDTSRGEMLLYENEDIMLANAFAVSCKYILYHSFRVFICMLAATIHCRHLMVWKIFAPKLIFEAIGILVTLTSVLLGYLFLSHINNKVDNLVTSLKKQSR